MEESEPMVHRTAYIEQGQIPRSFASDGLTTHPRDLRNQGMVSTRRALCGFGAFFVVYTMILLSVDGNNFGSRDPTLRGMGTSDSIKCITDSTRTSTATPASESTTAGDVRTVMVRDGDKEGVVIRHPDDVAFDRLMAWMLKAGAVLHGVEGRRMFAGGGRGLYALEDIKKGDHLFSIPAILWLSGRNAHLASAVGNILSTDSIARKYDQMEGDGWDVVLMMQHERNNPFSFWEPYLNFIPNPASPIFSMTDEEVESMQSDTILRKVRSNRKTIKDTYDELMGHMFEKYPNMFDPEVNTLDSFTADTVTAWSRSYDVSHSGEPKQVGLVPLGDLLNHVTGTPPSHWKMSENKNPIKECLKKDSLSFEFKAPENKKPDEEIVISYGDHRAAFSWLLWAGFLPRETNDGDYIAIRVDPSQIPDNKSAELSDEAKHLTAWVAPDGHIPLTFLKSYQRVVNAQTGGGEGDWTEALQSLLNQIRAQETALPTTLESDEEAFAALPEGGRYQDYVILLMRVRFKRIIRQTRTNLEWRLERYQKNGELKWPNEQQAGALAHTRLGKHEKWSHRSSNSYALKTLLIDYPTNL